MVIRLIFWGRSARWNGPERKEPKSRGSPSCSNPGCGADGRVEAPVTRLWCWIPGAIKGCNGFWNLSPAQTWRPSPCAAAIHVIFHTQTAQIRSCDVKQHSSSQNLPTVPPRQLPTYLRFIAHTHHILEPPILFSSSISANKLTSQFPPILFLISGVYAVRQFTSACHPTPRP